MVLRGNEPFLLPPRHRLNILNKRSVRELSMETELFLPVALGPSLRNWRPIDRLSL